MGLFAVGELVVIPFPYSDLSVSTMRPSLIIASLKDDDFIMVQVTSKSYDDKFAVQISNIDLMTGKLYFDSYAKYSKIFTANSSLITKSIGKINSEKHREIINRIIELLKGEE